MANKKVTVSIVNYNAGDYLLRCIRSILDYQTEAELEIFLIDNDSTDGSFEKAKKEFGGRVSFIKNNKNLGFGKAHNIVLKNLKTHYVLILNPDIILKKGVLKTLLDYLEDYPDTGAITPKIVFENGTVDMTAHRGFPTPWASLRYFLGDDSLYHLTKRNLNSIHEVDAITGAFLLTKKEVLDKVGGFDEDYFMYAEDIDLCFRIKEKGFKVIYDPLVEVLHYKGISTGLKKHSQHQTSANLETRLRSLNAFYETMKIFYRKHMEDNYPAPINWLIYLAIDIKWWLAKRKLIV